MRKFLGLAILFVCSIAAFGQTTQITASHIAMFGGQNITGQFCVAPVTSAGDPITLVTNTGQQFAPQTPLCFPIVNGVLSSTAIVPDVSQVQPFDSCYALTIYNNLNIKLGSYPCIQPTGSTWSFDSYVPGTLPNGTSVTLPQFLTNGTPNATQGTLNLSGPGVTYGAGGVVSISSSGVSTAVVTAAMVTGGLDAFQVINTVASTLPSGSLIDATGLGAANYVITHQLTALNQTSKAITLELNSGVTFTINTAFSGTLTASPSFCAVPIGPPNGSSGGFSGIIVPGYNSLNGNFLVGPSARVWDVVCNGQFATGQESLRLDGVHVQGNASATVMGALMHLKGMFVPTRVTNSGTYQCYAQCLQIDTGTSTGTSDLFFDDDAFVDGASSGTYPGSVVNIDAPTGGIYNVMFVGGTIQDNGPHNPLLTINGHGGTGTGGISFLLTDFEYSPAATSSYWTNVDPIQLTDINHVYFSSLLPTGNTNSTYQTHLVDLSESSPGLSYGFRIEGITVPASSGFACLIHNTIEGTCETGFVSGTYYLSLPPYHYGETAPQVRQTNTTPPTTPGACVIGSIWTNSSASTLASTFLGCAGTSGSQTYQALGSGGSMTWPSAAGIAVYAGSSAWGTSLTAPSGTIVGTSDTQTLTNKTLTAANLGTPTALTLTNATGLPWSGLSGSPSTSQVPVQSLTTTGTSGAATLSGGVLNVPQYTGSSATFQANGTNLTSGSTVNFENSAATNGLTLTFANPSAGNVQLGFTGTLTNAGLANSATTVNSQTCTLGSSCTIPFQTNSSNNTSQAGLNLLTSTTNSVGLTVTPTNSGTNQEKFEITGASYSGTASSATNLAGTGVDYAPYQSASGATSYITAPTTNADTFVYAWKPTGSAVAPTAVNLGALPANLPTSSVVDTTTTQTLTGKTLDGVTSTIMGYLDATSSIQTQLNAKTGWPSAAGIAVYAGSSAWGTSLTAPSGTIVGTSDTQTLTNKTLDGVTSTTMGYLDATSSIQTQLNGKAATNANTTGTAGNGAAAYTLSGATPTAVVSSTSIPAPDQNFLLMSANVTSFTLPASTAVANGEVLRITVQQGASTAYTLPTGTANSPFTAGSGTTLVNTVPTGCPTIGTTTGSVTPSEEFFVLQYHSALTEWEILGCNTSVAQTAIIEAPIQSTGTFGGTAVNTVVASISPTHSGHIANLVIVNTNASSNCTTAPTFNVFDGTTNTGTAKIGITTAQTKGNATSQSQSLAFNAGDIIGIYISTAGGTCTVPVWSVSAMVTEP